MIEPALYLTDEFLVFQFMFSRCKSRKFFREEEYVNIQVGGITAAFSVLFFALAFTIYYHVLLYLAFIFLYISSMNVLFFFFRGNELHNQAFRLLLFYKYEVARGILAFYLAVLIPVMILIPFVYSGNVVLVIIFALISLWQILMLLSYSTSLYIDKEIESTMPPKPLKSYVLIIQIILSVIIFPSFLIYLILLLNYWIQGKKSHQEYMLRNPSTALLAIPSIVLVGVSITLIPIVNLLVLLVLQIDLKKTIQAPNFKAFNEIKISRIFEV